MVKFGRNFTAANGPHTVLVGRRLVTSLRPERSCPVPNPMADRRAARSAFIGTVPMMA